VTDKKISKESQAEALKIAKGTQKKGQTKEQTKIVAQGIEKGIAEYKKQQKVKARDRDKLRKKELRAKVNQEVEPIPPEKQSSDLNWVPWMLLATSWVGFIAYFMVTNSLI